MYLALPFHLRTDPHCTDAYLEVSDRCFFEIFDQWMYQLSSHLHSKSIFEFYMFICEETCEEF